MRWAPSRLSYGRWKRCELDGHLKSEDTGILASPCSISVGSGSTLEKQLFIHPQPWKRSKVARAAVATCLLVAPNQFCLATCPQTFSVARLMPCEHSQKKSKRSKRSPLPPNTRGVYLPRKSGSKARSRKRIGSWQVLDSSTKAVSSLFSRWF